MGTDIKQFETMREKRERERERERETERDRERDRERKRETETEREREVGDIQTDGQTEADRHKYTQRFEDKGKIRGQSKQLLSPRFRRKTQLISVLFNLECKANCNVFQLLY